MKFRHNDEYDFLCEPILLNSIDIVLFGYEKADFLRALHNFFGQPGRLDRSDESINVHGEDGRLFSQEWLKHWLGFWPDEKINKALQFFLRRKLIWLVQLVDKNAEQKTVIIFNHDKYRLLRNKYLKEVRLKHLRVAEWELEKVEQATNS